MIRRVLAPARGFTLVEVMIVMAIIAVLMAIGYPSYTNYVIRSHRSAAQQELLNLAAVQEKIYLNSSAYSSSITDDYTGQADGGLGKTGGTTDDEFYELSVVVPAGGQSFTLTATPATGTMQEDDGVLTINSSGVRTWDGEAW
jgi:type IV pilus assembly protein PilE